MKAQSGRLILALGAALAVAVLPLAVRAAGGPHPAPAQPQAAPAAAPNATEGFMATWKDIAGKIAVMADDFPEDKYDFKPTPEVRSFAEQLLHVTGSIYYFQALMQGQKPPDDPARSNFKNKAEIVAYAKKALAEGTAMLEKTDFSKAIPRPQRPINPYRFWSDVCEHTGEHYGQMVVYYRLNGIVPPDSRPKK